MTYVEGAVTEEREIEVPIIKRGELCMQVNLKRNTVGLFVNIKVHPGIEEFARNLGTGDTQDVRTLGRYWTPTKQPASENGLTVYNMGSNPGTVTGANGIMFNLDRPGNPLVSNSGVPIPNNRNSQEYPLINLSFLRLQGISDGAGVNFHVRGVYTSDAVKLLAAQVKDALQAFYVTYLKPIDMDVLVMTQEKSV